MLLAIEVGNTNIGLAVYRGAGKTAERVADWRLRTARDRTVDEYGMLVKLLLAARDLTPIDIQHIALSNVVPALQRTLDEMARRYFQIEPFSVHAGADLGIQIHYRPASDVGADRLCSVVGAFAQYGGPAIVIDCGTATTFNAVAANGDFLGGAIAPGLVTSMDALARQAALLSRVELTPPPHAIGTSTVEALQSGLVFGYAGQVDAMVGRFRAEMGVEARVVATGGLAGLIQPESRTIDVVDPWITLEGLRVLFERRRK